MKEQRLSVYESLAAVILPPDILDLYEIVKVEVEDTGNKTEIGTDEKIIHFHLDERRLPDEECAGLRPNGFTEECKVNDFPIRDHKVVLHVRRRRWLTEDGHNKVFDRYDVTAAGTRYSKEFAGVLKKIFGRVPDTGPFSGAVL